MKVCRLILVSYMCLAVLPCLVPAPAVAQTVRVHFRDVLESAGIEVNDFVTLGEVSEFDETDWRLMLQVYSRFRQFSDIQPASPLTAAWPEAWSTADKLSLGEVFEIEGLIVAAKEVTLPARLAEIHDYERLYQCTFQFPSDRNASKQSISVLTTRIPRAWRLREEFPEPVRVRGVLVRLLSPDQSQTPLLLTHHIAWYPTVQYPTGMLLLARHGMDVALLDEVVQRQPFVKPGVSREGEAFYAALTALRLAGLEEIVELARKNVARVADAWQAHEPALRSRHEQLQADLAQADGPDEQEMLQRKIKQVKTSRGIVAAVGKQAGVGLSSVAPLFLKPETEVGELYVLEGIARRAVRIVADDQPRLEAYYELEVFTSDSQNLPIVCCVTQLPKDFPTGDEIREPVRLAGVFFKSWRYRARSLADRGGQTDGRRQLYTPVLLGRSPAWLQKADAGESRGALWGGVAFLTVLVALWAGMIWLARRDRLARESLRRTETIDI